MFFTELLFILEKCKRQAAGDDQAKEDTSVISMITCLNVSCKGIRTINCGVPKILDGTCTHALSNESFSVKHNFMCKVKSEGSRILKS